MRIGARIVLALVAASSSPAAFAQTEQQTGQWQVEVAPAQCRLSRSIAGPRPFAVSIQTVPGSDAYRLTLAGPDLRGIVDSQLGPAELVFSGGSRIAVLARAARLDGELATAVQMDGIAPELLDRLAGGSTITLRRSTRESSPLALANAAKAIVALRRCNADQLIEWGADPAQFGPEGSAPVALASRDDWLTNSQLLKLASGRTEVNEVLKVQVATDGRIDGCDALEGGDVKFAKAACAFVNGRKLFVPAHAPDGTALRGAATFPIVLVRRPNL